MKQGNRIVTFALFTFTTIGCFLLLRGHSEILAEGLYQDISVTMYPLKDDGSRDRDQQPPLCQSDDPSTPGNEADTRYGCTAFPGENSEYPYPYSTNPATVSIEDDYLLDVVPREMGTYYHPLALESPGRCGQNIRLLRYKGP